MEVSGNTQVAVRICPVCNRPTYIEGDKQFPGEPFGFSVENVSEEIEALYEEARSCAEVSAYTPAVLACRKILMHVAVDKGAKEGLTYLDYVSYLGNNNYVPPDGKGWVDYIRKRGNEANHQIVLMEKKDAHALLKFVEMLLRFVYELPAKVPKD